MSRGRKHSTIAKIRSLERRALLLSDQPGVLVTTRNLKTFLTDVVEILQELSSTAKRADEAAERAMRGPYAE
jgi:hypothetical protein